jgi:tRNA A-37 threonylcarbamoyl transferase component Bud32
MEQVVISQKSNMSKKIMTQLKKMHKLGISHSDLHAGNIMVDGTNRSSSTSVGLYG